MTGRAIRGKILFEIDHIGPTEERDDTKVENRIFPHIAGKLLYVIGSAKRGTNSKICFLLFLKCRIITHKNESNFELIAYTFPEF